MKLPKRLYYPLPEAARKIGCSMNDMFHYISTKAIEPSVFVDVDFSTFPEDRSMHVVMKENVMHAPTFHCLDEFFYLKENGWIISDLNYSDKQGAGDISGYYAKKLHGFFYIEHSNIIDFEFNEDAELWIESLLVKLQNKSDSVIYIDFMDSPIKVDLNKLCVMSHEMDNIKENGQFHIYNGDINLGELQPVKNVNESKQAKLIKALIEIQYGVGSSSNINALINEERGTGELLKDLQLLGIKPPVTRKALKGWLDGVELDYVGISTPIVDKAKK